MKKLITGMVFVILILVAQSNSALNTLPIDDKSIETVTVNQNEELPDFNFTYIAGFYDYGPQFVVAVVNDGNISINECIQLKITIKRLNLSFPYREYIIGMAYEVDGYYYYACLRVPKMFPLLKFYVTVRCYFEIDPNNEYEESNEDNNKVWAYFLICNSYLLNYLFSIEPIRLGEFKPYS